MLGQGSGDGRHQQENFDRSFETLNNLDDSPSLANTPGFERLITITDWLDSWIRNQRPNETWKPHTAFQNVEIAAQNAANTSKNVAQTLALLRGESVFDDAGQPINATESLQTERQAMGAGLEELVQQTQELGSLAQLPAMGQFSETILELQRRFDALDNIPNLTAAGIRSFARTLDFEANVLDAGATVFEAYARQLQTDGLFITISDVEYLKQSTWMRDISRWAGGDRRVLLEQAVQLCDWVVCNVEMRSSWTPINQQQAIAVLQQYPWQTVLLGYGTASDRMTVFMELLRQQRIDSALLAVPDPRDPDTSLNWAVGVLLDGEVYVFLLNYGFPIPGPDGVQVGEDGALQFPSVATLTQLIEDESLLRRLDISVARPEGEGENAEQPFPVTSEMLRQTTAHLFLMPESVSMRMKVLEGELSAEQSMVLYTDPDELRRRFLAAPGITGVEFWKYPFRTAFEQRFDPGPTNEALSIFLVDRPRLDLDGSAGRRPSSVRHFPLWSGRIRYFRGEITGQENALTKYQNTRVSDREMVEYRTSPVFRSNPILGIQLQWLSIQATHWLGSALFEIDSISASKDALSGIRTNPLNTWRHSTEYLLGRIAEREGRYDDARRHYANTSASLSGMGNAVRAQWLPE